MSAPLCFAVLFYCYLNLQIILLLERHNMEWAYSYTELLIAHQYMIV